MSCPPTGLAQVDIDRLPDVSSGRTSLVKVVHVIRIGLVSTCPPIEYGIATYTEGLNRVLRKLANETFVMSQFGAHGESAFPVYQPDSPTLAADVFFTGTRMTPQGGREMTKFKVVSMAVLGLLVLIIVLQNTEAVETKLLFASVTMPRAVLLFGTLLTGFALGVLTAGRISRKPK